LLFSWIVSHKSHTTKTNSPSNVDGQTNYASGGNPNDQGNAQGGNPSKQGLSQTYRLFKNEENQFAMAGIGSESQQLTQAYLFNPNQQTLAALQSFHRNRVQQAQYLLNKLSGLPDSPDASSEISRFKQTHHAFLFECMQLEQYYMSNPTMNSPTANADLQSKGKDADDASARLEAKLGFQ